MLKKFFATGLVTAFCLVFEISTAYGVPAVGQKIMIAGPSPNAVEIGKDISKKGGNVVDVAVAVALSLSVTHPYYASLGGGGFALLKLNKKVDALDFRETAPKQMTSNFFSGKPSSASVDGPLAIGVPGIPSGLWELHKRYGSLHWSRLFPKVIELASKGFEVSGEWADITTKNTTRFNEAGKRYFFKKNKIALKGGEKLTQEDLAKVLKEMSVRGPVPFYSGMVARDIVETVQSQGGVLSLADMKSYKPRWLRPLEANYSGFKAYLMPPPSSGGIVIKSALRLADLLHLQQTTSLSVDEFHLIGEILKQSFAGRTRLGDPDFHKNPIEELTSESYLAELAKRVDPAKAYDTSIKVSPAHESSQTTHFSVMDSDGNSVAMTLTLNGSYGSGVVSTKYGIALNNEIDDFTTQIDQANQYGLIQGTSNQIEAGKRPLSSMSPTIVEKDGETVLSLGAPGGPRIISAVFQVMYRTLRGGVDIDQAIQAPRVHHQFTPNTLYIDTHKFSPEIAMALKSKGHVLEEGSTAKVYGIVRKVNGSLEGAYDLRGEGAAGGF